MPDSVKIGSNRDGEANFQGPVFIIGMPRSGTKLLRELLNQHSKITIPVSETEFLPWIVRHQSRFGDLSDRIAFRNFYREISNTNYFDRMREEGGCISEDDWYHACSQFTPADLFETLIRHDTGIAYGSGKIWGDKSPSYIGHIELLKDLFPEARILYIVRDVRDHCLSMRRAWGKSLLRAAQRWTDASSKVEQERSQFPEEILRLRYEDLIVNAEAELKRVCLFLEVKYEASMQALTRSVENLGDATGFRGVKQDNSRKYLTEMTADMRVRIESLCWPILEEMDYPYDYVGEVKRLPRVMTRVLQVHDFINLARFHIGEHGWCKGFTVLWSLYSKSGNRQAS